MTFETTDHVPGLTDARVAELVEAAEAGHDLTDAEVEPNPHLGHAQVVPEELWGAIEERARQDGRSPEAVVREALSRYLDTA